MAISPRLILMGLACLALTACGGGGGGGGGNEPPIAAFTATPSSGPVPLVVAFDASGSSDPDGGIAGYRWTFGDGATGSGVSASHTYTAAGTFTVTLTVTDNQSASRSTTRAVTATSGPPPPTVTVRGRITFERVPFAAALGGGLNYASTVEAPAREVEVELLRASDQVPLATTTTDANGSYSFTAQSDTNVIVRARAVSRVTATTARPASWDIRVRDNTSGGALYVLDSSPFNTGVANQVLNLKAATGWGGSFSGVYTGTRAAAPFAILDTLYAAAQFVIAKGDASVQLMPLTAYWSVKNVPTDGNVALGQIGTTAYYPVGTPGIASGIYVLGAASNDTDEFDQSVVAHEYLHYLEDAISRSDTVGGSHSLDERLDMRVAFSEGFANAFSAMVLDNPVYRDSFGTAQASDFHFNIESRSTTAPGWYNETSVHRVAWDLFDTVNDDALSIGFGPMYAVFTGALRNGVPLTSLFPFITTLKQQPGVPATLVDQLVEAERVAGTTLGVVSATMDAYATTETFSGVSATSADLVLPVHTPVTVNGPAVRVCTSDTVSTAAGLVKGTYNKLGNRRFLRFSVPGARTVRIAVTCHSADVDCAGAPVPDPDFVVSRAFDVTTAESDTARVEQLDFPATAGDYVLEVYDWSHVDTSGQVSRGRTCMTVTITG